MADEEDDDRVPLTDGHRDAHLAVVAFDTDGRPTQLEHSFIVENECHGWRLDRFLMKRMRRLSRARVQRVIHGDLDIDGVRVEKPAATVQSGQRVSFRRPAPAEPPVVRDLTLLHDDPSFYAFDKPAGLPIHPTARYHYGTATALLRERFPGEPLQPCHRLDRETSGLLLVARNRAAGARLKQAFARRQIAKTYLAIVHGELTNEQSIDAPLALAGRRVRVQMAVRPQSQGGLPARTRIRPIERYGNFTLVEARPETGRQHQIRAHLAHIGYPIVGDKLYPDDAPFIEWADEGSLDPRLLLPRHALHAAALELLHPSSGEPLSLTSPLPADLADFLVGLTAADRPPSAPVPSKELPAVSRAARATAR